MNMSALLAALDLLPLLRQADGSFVLQTLVPAWAAPFFAPHFARAIQDTQQTAETAAIEISADWLVETFPFLDSFWAEAAEVWTDSQTDSRTDAQPASQPNSQADTQTDSRIALRSARRESASFCAASASGEEIQLVASALRVDDESYLLLDGNQRRLDELARLLQRARQADLVHQRLQRDVLKRDILFHSIVHDLTSQLSSLRGVLQLLQGDAMTVQQADLLQTGLRAAAKQESLIRDILDVFRSESSSDDVPVTELPPCDLSVLLQDSIALLAPSAAWRKVGLHCVHNDSDGPGPLVRAEPQRLERVLGNLLENALRHAPRNSAITVTLSLRDGQAVVTIDDDGPGVPNELAATLFEKFARSRQSGGKTGLGLYFCRLTIARFGGQIGYEPRTPGGARFWFSLPTASSKERPEDRSAAAR